MGGYLLYEASRLIVEEGVGERREDTAGGFEARDVVVGRPQAVGGRGQRIGGGHDDLARCCQYQAEDSLCKGAPAYLYVITPRSMRMDEEEEEDGMRLEQVQEE